MSGRLDGLLTVADLAARLSLSPRHVAERLVKRADFPRPAVALNRRARWWSRDDVERWLTQHAEQSAR